MAELRQYIRTKIVTKATSIWLIWDERRDDQFIRSTWGVQDASSVDRFVFEKYLPLLFICVIIFLKNNKKLKRQKHKNFFSYSYWILPFLKWGITFFKFSTHINKFVDKNMSFISVADVKYWSWVLTAFTKLL